MSMCIAAVMMVRNEAAVIADSVGHLLRHLRVDAVHVADNGSTDATPSILRRIAAADPRVRVTAAPGAYDQPGVMRALVRDAAGAGAAWILPTDADEFLWLSARGLRALCHAAPPGIGGWRLRVRNFAQWRGVVRDGPGSIATMTFRARPACAESAAPALVARGALPYLRIAYPPKLLLRATADLAPLRGQHHADGTAGPLPATPVADVLHAPIRARDDLMSRVAHGERAMALDEAPETSWHLKRLVGMTRAQLDAEWRANSVALPGGARGYVPDTRLLRLALSLRGFRAAMLGHAAATGRSVAPVRPCPASPGLALP